MYNLIDYPLAVFVLTLAGLTLASAFGVQIARRRTARGGAHPDGGALDDGAREDFNLVLGGTLTLLGLIIGFTFSMALNRDDQRKNFEEEEANAIGTEFVRADLLPAAEGAKVRTLLKAYVDQRMRFYATRDRDALREINAETAKVQAALWSTVAGVAATQPTPVVTLVVAGMNDVLNSQGYTQAAWWNRIPVAAWLLMLAIAVCANLLVGFGARRARREVLLLIVMPLVVAIAFFLIADIDSPRGGVIRVTPQNLHALHDLLRVQ